MPNHRVKNGPAGQFPYEPGRTGMVKYERPQDALPSYAERAMYRRRRAMFCFRCRTATLGPWHGYTSAHALRVHLQTCPYLFSGTGPARP